LPYNVYVGVGSADPYAIVWLLAMTNRWFTSLVAEFEGPLSLEIVVPEPLTTPTTSVTKYV
jgi:hypothetical protein